MNFRAIFSIKNKEAERCVYLSAEHKDAVIQRIESEIPKLYSCNKEDLEYYNIVSEFEEPSAINEFAVGWCNGKVIAVEENPLILN